MSSVRSPLADPTYRRLFAAQVIALAGTGLTTVALALLAYDLAGETAGEVLGTALALKMLAYVGLAPLAGALAGRWPRRQLLVVLDVIRAGLLCCLPFVSEVWHVYVLIVLLNACSAAFTPTFQATIPEVLPDEERYTRALSFSRLAYDLENLLSPLLAAAVLTVLTFADLFVLNSLAFLASALLIGSVVLPAAAGAGDGRWQQVGFGVRSYLATPRLKGLLALSVAVACAGAMVIVNTVVYVRDGLGGDARDTAIAFAAFGAGSMLAALLLPRLLDRHADRPFMLFGGALAGAGLLAAAAAPGWVPFLVLWCLLGAASSLVQTPAGRLLNRSAGEGGLPALFAAQFALSHACWLFAYPAAGWLGATLGLTTAFVVLGCICVAATVTAARFWPADDPEVLWHSHDAVCHTHQHLHDEHHQHEHEGWEGPEPHSHAHEHQPLRHRHAFVIDLHHQHWPIAQD